MEELKSMSLHREMYLDNYYVIRVIGGWIYTHKTEGCSSFVPDNSNING